MRGDPTPPQHLDLVAEPGQHPFAGVAVDIDGALLDVLGEGVKFLPADVHVELHRCGIGMQGDAGHRAIRLVDREVVGEELRLVGLGEGDQVGHQPLARLELAWPDIRHVDVEDRLGHRYPLIRLVQSIQASKMVMRVSSGLDRNHGAEAL
jgi:hypothetical protein